MNTPQYIVSIRCMTYNHASYIEDAMNGFCMQETKFPYLAVIVDDASTDGEPDVIKNYLHNHFDMQNARTWETDDAHFIEAIHKENSHCIFAVVLLKHNLYLQREKKNSIIEKWLGSKYIAFCEGDDYWINPHKLQKQVEYLESHLDIDMVHTAFRFYYQNTQDYKDSVHVESNLQNLEIIQNILDYHKYRVQTCTVVLRKNSWERALEINKEAFNPDYFLMGDTQLWIGILEIGKISYISDITAIYRLSDNSACCRGDYSIKRVRFDLSCSEMRLFFINKLRLDETFKKKIKRVFNRQLLLYCLFCPEYKSYNKNDIESRFRIIMILAKFYIIRQLIKLYFLKKGIIRLSYSFHLSNC